MNTEDIKRSRLEIENKIKKVNKNYYNKISILKNELEDLQNKCQHEDTLYMGDPAGGYDSFYSCSSCGKEDKFL